VEIAEPRQNKDLRLNVKEKTGGNGRERAQTGANGRERAAFSAFWREPARFGAEVLVWFRLAMSCLDSSRLSLLGAGLVFDSGLGR
jgi:hypothetical protein